MRRILTILALLGLAGTGCGNPCQEALTDNEIDVLIFAVEELQNEGFTKQDATMFTMETCIYRSCRDCLEWAVNIVY